MAAGLVVLASIGGFTWWMQRVAYRPLYTGLDEAEAGAIVQKLTAMEAPYRLAAGGTTILAPEQRIDEIRLQLASEGLPQTGRLGFELFDANSFGATEFAEQVNFRRALEGELERTIGSLVEVKKARVHISLPRHSVFLSRDQEAKASVVLELRQGHALGEEKTRAIAYLIASAVEGLDPEHVVVMDQLGRLFSQRYNGFGGELTDGQIEYRRKLENDAVRKILETLEPFLGPGGVRANVVMDVNWNSGEQTEEKLDPTPVTMSTQLSEERTVDAIPAGPPGAASNLPRDPAATTENQRGMTRTQETTNFQTSRTVKRMTLERGDIDRMSIAVLVDYRVALNEQENKLERQPREQRELDKIRELVVAASGAVAARGDTVTVESLPFTMLEDPPQLAAPPVDPADELFSEEWFVRHRLEFIAGAVALLLLIAVVAYIRRRKRLGRVRMEKEKALEAERERLQIEASEKAQEEERRLEEERILKGLKIAPPANSKTQILKKHLEGLAEEDAESFARLVKAWIHEDD
ncbi:MAG: flagellar basal-body MS-ring/collar protein FliF [Bryobacterales bacterium]